MTYRVQKGADHALSKKAWRQEYTQILVAWMNEVRRSAKSEEKALPPKHAKRYESWVEP